MRQAGEVTFTQCHKDRPGQGVVDFACEEDMRKAIKKLDGTELLGRCIRLSEVLRI
jgi:arginine/serine-rich splicing factor 4/5/6